MYYLKYNFKLLSDPIKIICYLQGDKQDVKNVLKFGCMSYVKYCKKIIGKKMIFV